ncbi:T3SS (YopN, CesT) and YbjN peptide-binding chaperone 1 [Rhodococcus yananensis]|uniref:T3SS (YopN, CesT) and YbjN peptide-binding chaperone 1 n=1 Tax=Rhodococcus yananensis TaxID=2879464 RepID=UPI001CF8137D|nr:hypothetical protein [Rhodococcus yananensis]
MTEGQNRFDRDVALAWRDFRRRLADHVAAMQPDDGLVLEPLAEETCGPVGPCVQFYAWGSGQVRCEVPSNAHLCDERQLRTQDELLLLELGWRAPSRGPADPEDDGSPAFWMDRPSAWADQLAEVAVTVLREVWGVPHPLFLRAETFGPGGAGAFAPPTPAPETAPPFAVDAAIAPLDADHLNLLIERTVADRVGDAPVRDEDGDLVLSVSGVLVFVGVSPGGGVVDVLAPVVHSVTGRTRASEVLADLNRQWPQLKFVLVDDRVAVVDHIAASPFVPAHLLASLDRISAFLHSLDAGFAAHLGGLPMRDHPSAFPTDRVPDVGEDDSPWTPEVEADLPMALLALRDLHAEDRAEAEPPGLAALGDWESARLEHFLDLSTEQHIGWTTEALDRAAAGDPDGTVEADAKALEWERTTRALSQALDDLERQATPRPRRRRAAASNNPEQPGLFDIPDEPTLFDGPGD